MKIAINSQVCLQNVAYKIIWCVPDFTVKQLAKAESVCVSEACKSSVMESCLSGLELNFYVY